MNHRVSETSWALSMRHACRQQEARALQSAARSVSSLKISITRLKERKGFIAPSAYGSSLLPVPSVCPPYPAVLFECHGSCRGRGFGGPAPAKYVPPHGRAPSCGRVSPSTAAAVWLPEDLSFQGNPNSHTAAAVLHAMGMRRRYI